MKKWLTEIAVTMLGGGLVCGLLLGGRGLLFRPPITIVPPAVGEAFRFLGSEVAQTRQRTIVLATRPDCAYCRASMGFHKHLEELARSGKIGLSVIVPNKKAANEYLDEVGVDSSAVYEGDFRQLKIPGTPALLLLDNKGVVLKTWVGQLGQAGEQEVEKRAINHSVPFKLSGTELDRLREARDGQLQFVDIVRRETSNRVRTGWLHIPIDEMEARLPVEIDLQKTVVLDCDNSFAAECDTARQLLESRGVADVTSINRGANEPNCAKPGR